MDYPTLLRHLEGNLRLLDARGTKYIGLESLEGEELAAVSYTHLTLPTKRIV